MTYAQDISEINRRLPTKEDIRNRNWKADAHFEIRDDGGGEFVLWLVDMRGTQAGHYGEGIERHIKMYTGIPSAEEVLQDAVRWLDSNAWWL